ncbi:hypothetical protein K0028_10125 [Curtobacterium flaccumfaciens pv. flaccumfaciens]|uniref:hypothetical protein n=1 Tax=Curtobacterium flaccumfaciens TaxID=2035 RepID=UPI0021B09E70|nr:hypothetical protein [Curtobacterium flaccumfaciens]QYI96078.1 hypothetical protein K0028_10125 [Curtobacterium flaccumfaciens pv. flaccumfaciens]
MSGTAVVELARAGLGLCHLSRAARGSDQAVLHGVLGVRQLAQAVLVARVGSGNAHTLSAVVDALHGATMVPLAVDPRRRRFAVDQLWIAAVLAIAEAAVVGRGGRR